MAPLLLVCFPIEAVLAFCSWIPGVGLRSVSRGGPGLWNMYVVLFGNGGQLGFQFSHPGLGLPDLLVQGTLVTAFGEADFGVVHFPFLLFRLVVLLVAPHDQF